MVKITRERINLILVLVFAFFAVQASLPQKVHAQSSVYVASLDQNIDPGAEDFVVSSINDATSSGIHNFILILNTNGGSGANMENIISAISNYEANGNNNFTTLVAPTSAHAFSAGAYIAEASSSIFMVPGTVIGSATPIVSGIPTGEENTTLTKDINAFTAYMQALTGSHGRNPNSTALMVTHGVSYTCQTTSSCSALQQGVINQVLNVNSTQQALTILHAGDATIHYAGTRSIFLSIISDPNLDSILFLAGVFALLGLGVFGAPLVSIILMMIGAIFIFLELKTHHGVSAIAGVVIFIVGFLLIFSLPSSTPAQAPPGSSGASTFIQIGVLTYTILGIVGGGGVLGSIYLYHVRETLMHRPPAQNPKAIIGKTGRLTSDLKAGEVATANIGAEDFTVTGSTDLASGTLVRVKDIQGLRLIVERAEK